jgi:8-oxo-dGTP pyrophosphatase MutT (NUDIX family)
MDNTSLKPVTPWTVLSTRHIHRDRWLSVRVDECVTDEGVLIAPYYVVEYGDWACVVAIDDADRVILVEQYRHGIGTVALPGGGIDPDDGDVMAAARRELLEETGYAATSWQAIAQLANNPPSQNNWCTIVLAQGAAQVREAADSPTERLRTHRVPVAEVVRMAREGAIPHSMEVAALSLALGSIGRW